MSCFTSISGSDALSPTSLPSSIQETKEKTYGKVFILNGDGSVVAAGTIVPVGERTQLHGRIRMNPVLKIKSDDDNQSYDQAAWIAKYNAQVKHKSVYASDPEAAKAYAENIQKANAAAAAAAAARNAPRTPVPPRTPRPVVAPVPRTVFGMHQPPPSTTPLNLAPLPFKFDLPPLPPMVTTPRLI
jgi:hypothetical protein